jgi:hypothetical protein
MQALMQQSYNVMELALRVLNALTYKRNPDPNDIDALHQLAPDFAGLPADELACQVIQRALKCRAEVRTRTSDSTANRAAPPRQETPTLQIDKSDEKM